MTEIMNIYLGKQKEIVIDGNTYQVNEAIMSLAKKMFYIYEFFIAVFTIIGINIAPLIGSKSFFSDVLLIAILLLLLTLIFSKLKTVLFKRLVK